VLVSPLDRQNGSFVVRELGTPTIPTTSIVLTVEQPVCIVPIAILVQTVVVASGVLHIDITQDIVGPKKGDKYNK
jgi:hypothetical protein